MGERAIDVRGASLEESRAVMAAVLRMRPHGAAAGSNNNDGEAGIRRLPPTGESPAKIEQHSAS